MTLCSHAFERFCLICNYACLNNILLFAVLYLILFNRTLSVHMRLSVSVSYVIMHVLILSFAVAYYFASLFKICKTAQ